MASVNEQEIEAKFLVQHLAGLEKRLQSMGAQLDAPRVHEINLRFDKPSGELSQARQVLRLRQDANSVMTFKGPAQADQPVSVRQEIEFVVSDFGAARRLLEALGYQVVVMYEKFRTSYRLENLVIVLDEMPYGHFAEIEGPNAVRIEQVARALKLNWEERCGDSYLAIFDRLRAKLKLPATDLSFEALAGKRITPAKLGLAYADGIHHEPRLPTLPR
jgi:adenylate cyclase, class 2